LVVERLAVRPFLGTSPTGWLIATVALGIIVDNIVLFTFGKEPRSLPSPLAVTPASIGSVELGVYPLQLVIPVVALGLSASLSLLSTRTRWGIALRGVVQNRDAARLMGIPVHTAVAFSFALSSVLAGIAGMLIAPLLYVSASMGTIFGLKAFAVAILGGINNPRGILTAGLLFGVAERLITTTLGSSYTQIITFAAVIVVLAIRPSGLFGRAEVKKL
jgi:branched-chain amino acid transport system permease protein